MPLTSLPPELILEICDFLPLDGILALKLTDPHFNTLLPLAPRARNTTLSDCARLAIRTYLASPQSEPSHMRCILCKAVYPVSLFDSSSSPACRNSSPGRAQPDIVALPDRMCAWHVGRLARIVSTGPGGRNGWMSQMARMCMHCGMVEGAEKCTCDCDSCSFRPVRTYTRFLGQDAKFRTFAFWRAATPDDAVDQSGGAGNQLWVRETRRDASDRETISNLPVHFEDE